MTLPFVLRANAAFSLATGLLLAVAPDTVGGWLDVSIDGWLRLLGLALLGHGGLLLWASQRESVTWWAKLNLAAIAPYPLMMTGVVANGLVETSTGRLLLLLDGAIVGILAIVQWAGLRTATRETHPVPA